MGETGTTGNYQTIDRVAVDALVDGLSKSLDYLNDQKPTILRRMGDLMLQYLIDVGSVSSPDEPDAFAQSLSNLLAKNGYGPQIPLEFEGTPPRPSIPDFVGYLKTRRSKEVRGGERVDWVVYEMLLYGMTKALDEMGMQAQLLLDQIGVGMTEYLVVEGVIEPSDDPDVFFKSVEDFFMGAGYAGSFEFRIEGSPPHTFVSTYRNARYYENVLRRLRNEGSALLSCPMCMIGQSIYAKSWGLKFQNLTEFRFLPGDRVILKGKIYQPAERFTDEEEKKLSRMMG